MSVIEITPSLPTAANPPTPPRSPGLTVPRVFSTEGVSPYDQVEWESRTAEITDEKGATVFRQEGCEVPKGWSPLATNIVASKYFHGDLANGTDPHAGGRETSVRHLVGRVTSTIHMWGEQDGYFASTADALAFYDELTYLCLNQYGSFNSPVWFNVGLYHCYGIEGAANNWRWDRASRSAVRVERSYEYPQGSACFIQSVGDDMESIMALAASEAMLFKYGSGTGTDLSTLRSSKEKLSGGGTPSGPVSFMRVYDSIAGVIKSGGKSRRAAKMQTLKAWHPDILEFIECKSKEEEKARTLIAAGYPSDFNGEAYSSVMFQNANLTVRASDAFLRAVEAGATWTTRGVMDGRPMGTHRAPDLMDRIAEGTHFCGDPGLQYEDTIDRWHTVPNSAPINSSNPCSEYMHIDDSACNLASLNLMKFRREDGTFDANRFRAACRVFIIAQEILVDHGSYPTAKIAENSHRFRPLGLGYANLGCLLMASGLPYDSDEGRATAGAITAIMHGQAYLTSSEVASRMGAFEGFAENREPMLAVIQMHADAVKEIGGGCPAALLDEAYSVWRKCRVSGREHGYRNSQVTVLAPTGTIAFMMDCDTTGVEPDIALVKYKRLAGGGMLKIVNQTVPMALEKLGYDDPTIARIIDHVDARDTIEGAPGLLAEHLPVFDCAFAPPRGGRSIHFRGHLKMMAAVQPFLSGAISKTCNVPADATVADIREAYMEGWRLGLKAIAIYRDGSKGSQPVSTSSDQAVGVPAGVHDPRQAAEIVGLRGQLGALESRLAGLTGPYRKRLPDTRQSVTHKFDIQGHEGYFTISFFEDGQVGELFITMSKEGSTVAGLMDTIGTLTSMGLQYGVPLSVFVNKFAHVRFEPSGFTPNRDVPIAKSIIDYIFRWIGMNYVPGYRETNGPQPHFEAAFAGEEVALSRPGRERTEDATRARDGQFARFQSDAPACDVCGSITVRNGSCYRCHNCGNSMGCS